MILRTRRSRSSAATSVSPLPALLVTTVRSLAPCSSSACVSSTGTPELPKPPTSTVAPSRTPSTAAASVGTRLSSTAPPRNSIGLSARGWHTQEGQYEGPAPSARRRRSRRRGEPHEALHQRLCPVRRAAHAGSVPPGCVAHRRGRGGRLRVRPGHVAGRAPRRLVRRRLGAEEHLRVRPPDDYHLGGRLHPGRRADRAARAGPRRGAAE